VGDKIKKEERDEELEKRLEMFDGWVKEGKIPSSSKVIPIMQSVSALQWVLPTQQMIELLRNSRSFALANCACRARHKRCDNPLGSQVGSQVGSGLQACKLEVGLPYAQKITIT
jgi:hypothetical protein